MINTFLGAIIGVLFSIPISIYFYKKAGKELREQIDELRKLNKLTIHILGEAGFVTLNDLSRDSDGKLNGGIKKNFDFAVIQTVTPHVDLDKHHNEFKEDWAK